MRLWSIHPKYLDSKGLVALWREALLAQAVLNGKTKGYKNHPQLERFRDNEHTLTHYLYHIWLEATINRDYHFDICKFPPLCGVVHLPVSTGQLLYEWDHLCIKLEKRDSAWLGNMVLPGNGIPETHPLFLVVDGPISPWEKIKGEEHEANL